MIIGQPKNITEVKVLTEEEATQLIGGIDPMLASGTPLDMPAIALTIIDFARIVATLHALRQEIAKAKEAAPEEAPVEEAAPKIDLSRFSLG